MTDIDSKIAQNIELNDAGNSLVLDDLDVDSRETMRMNMATFAKTLKNLEELELPEINKKPAIHLAITNDSRLNAYASVLDFFDRKNDDYLVAIYFGAFQSLYACFFGLLSHPKVLPHIGKPAKEKITFDKFTFGLVDFGHEVQNLNINYYPLDKTRAFYANTLTTIALEFLFLHELAHILCGHINFIKSNSFRGLHHTLYADLSEEKVNNLPLRKIIEYDADAFAAYVSAGMFVNNKRGILNNFYKISPTKKNFYDMINFAMLCVFQILEETRFLNDETHSGLYPSPEVRFFSVYDAFTTRLIESGSNWEKTLNKSFESTVTHFIEICYDFEVNLNFLTYQDNPKIIVDEIDELKAAASYLKQDFNNLGHFKV